MTLEAIDWQALPDAFGQIDRVPFLLRQLASGSDAERKDALEEAWGTLWHQGTVYACTPPAVPFLVDVIADTDVKESVRTQLGLPASEVARAESFVLPGNPNTQWSARPLSDRGNPPRDLDMECRDAVAAQAQRLSDALMSAGPALEAASWLCSAQSPKASRPMFAADWNVSNDRVTRSWRPPQASS